MSSSRLGHLSAGQQPLQHPFWVPNTCRLAQLKVCPTGLRWLASHARQVSPWTQLQMTPRCQPLKSQAHHLFFLSWFRLSILSLRISQILLPCHCFQERLATIVCWTAKIWTVSHQNPSYSSEVSHLHLVRILSMLLLYAEEKALHCLHCHRFRIWSTYLSLY